MLIFAGIAQFVFALYSQQAGLLVFQGVLQAIVAFQLRPVEGWGWFLVDAVCELVLGVMILASWPSSTAWAIRTLVGASILVNGISRIAVASKIRSGATRVQQFAGGRA